MNQSITFDIETDQAHDVALAVAYAFGLDSLEDLLAEVEEDHFDMATGDSSEEPTYPDGWKAAKMKRYIKALKPNAKEVLKVIATHTPSAPIATVQAESGLEGYVYAGSMSSFGFAARNTHGVKDKPFTKVGKTYEMDPGVAKLVLEVVDAL